MRRGLASRWAWASSPLVYGLALVALSGSRANADPDIPLAPVQLGYGAMPGGLHAPSANVLPNGEVAVTALTGYGYRSDLLGPKHSFLRGTGGIAVAFAPLDVLTIGLSLDGHADKHYGIGQDDGFVGDPRLIARVAKAAGHVRFGGELTLWVPGKDAPSVAGSAISVTARALASIQAGKGTLGLSAGFRLDNSLKSVDNLDTLSAQDKVSLGVSRFNAAVAGVSFTTPLGAKAFITLEGSAELFVGSGAPGPILRVGASGGLNLTPQWSALAFVEGVKVPGLLLSDVMANDITIIAYEPVFTVGAGLQARFGGPTPKASGTITTNKHPEAIAVVETATLKGVVLDEAGKPVVGASVTVKTAHHTGTDVTDETGGYAVEKLPIGQTVHGVTTLDDAAAELTVTVDGKKPASQTLTLVTGDNAVPNVTLDPLLPPGQLMAVVRAAGSGKPIVGATVVVEPGNVTATTGPDGSIGIDLAPGTYKAKVTAPGYKGQTLDVTIDTNGVAVKNFELPK